MSRLEKTEILPYRARDLQDLVMNAERYTEFTDWVREINVVDLAEDKSRRQVSVLIQSPKSDEGTPLRFNYACILESDAAAGKIRAVAVESPFNSMTGEMTFRTLPNGHTEVSCVVDYDRGWKPVAIGAAIVMNLRMQWAIDKAKEYLATRLPRADAAAAPAAPPAPGL